MVEEVREMRGVSVGILALGLLDEEGEENESSPYTQAAHVFGVWRKVGEDDLRFSERRQTV